MKIKDLEAAISCRNYLERLKIELNQYEQCLTCDVVWGYDDNFLKTIQFPIGKYFFQQIKEERIKITKQTIQETKDKLKEMGVEIDE